MSMTLTKIKALKPDVLIISGHEKGALTAIPQIDALKFYLPILAMTHCGSAQVAEKLGLVAEYAFCTSMVRVALMCSARPATSPRRSRAPIATDAFKRAQSLDPEKVPDAIAATDVLAR
jgi:branched-chain amino acid transport system substrate-binding protein